MPKNMLLAREPQAPDRYLTYLLEITFHGDVVLHETLRLKDCEFLFYINFDQLLTSNSPNDKFS